jgi:hypothetical protein
MKETKITAVYIEVQDEKGGLLIPVAVGEKSKEWLQKMGLVFEK